MRTRPSVVTTIWTALILLLIATIAEAATWNGGASPDPDWTDPANWNGTAPVPPEALIFAGITNTSTNNDFLGATFNGITFDATAAPFSLAGNGLTLGGALAGVKNGINNDSLSLQTVGLGVTLDTGVHHFFGGAGGLALNPTGGLGRNAGSVAVFTPEAGGITTATIANNAAGIIGGFATLGSGAQVPAGSGIIVGSDWASVDNGGNVVAYTGYLDYVTGTDIPDIIDYAPLSNLRINSSSVGDITVDTPNANTVTDINTINLSNARATSIQIGAGNTLRLGAQGGIYRSDATTANINWAIGSGIAGGNGVQDEGTLTAGGAANTAGEIVFTINSPSQSAGSLNVDALVADNGTGSVSVVKTGPGSMKFRGHNTYTGGTYILEGRFQVAGLEIGTANPSGFGTGPVFVMPGGQAFPSGADSLPVTNSFTIAGVGTFAEPLGAIRLSGATTGAIVSGTITLAGNARLGGGSSAAAPGLFSGQITGAFNLEFGSPATIAHNLEISNPANNWSGDTKLVGRMGGTATHFVALRLGASEVIPHGPGNGNLTIEGGNGARTTSLNLNGFNETVNGLHSAGTLANAVIQNLAASTNSLLTVGGNDQTATFGGIIRDNNGSGGTVALRKIGGGTQTLAGANTYSSGTTIDGGKLSVTNTSGSGTGSGPVTLNAGATLGGTGSVVGTITSIGGIIEPGLSPGTLTVGTLLLDGVSNLNWELDATNQNVGGGINDLVVVTSDLTLDGDIDVSVLNGTELPINFIYRLFNYSGNLTNNGLAIGTVPVASGGTPVIEIDLLNKHVNLRVVPEPASFILAAVGLVGLIGLLRANRRKS